LIFTQVTPKLCNFHALYEMIAIAPSIPPFHRLFVGGIALMVFLGLASLLLRVVTPFRSPLLSGLGLVLLLVMLAAIVVAYLIMGDY
jgi:hypothetical protein